MKVGIQLETAGAYIVKAKLQGLISSLYINKVQFVFWFEHIKSCSVSA